jgi:tRNA(fMet)-specific endonuclease VapC
MSWVTYGELCFGAEKSSQRASTLERLERLQSMIPVITPDPAVGERNGAIRAHLERAGTPIGNNDLWIVAHALSLGVTLVSNNTLEFKRVPKLKLANWAD